jgi:N-acetylneuraminic acid mutarotase
MKIQSSSPVIAGGIAAWLTRHIPLTLLVLVLLDFTAWGAPGGWTFAASMNVARSRHTSVLLPDGRVLVTGGLDANVVATASVELYDPVSNSWQLAPNMHQARSRHTATVLADGRVLIAGGRGENELSLNGTEVFDPASGTWSRQGDLAIERDIHTATLLADGRVLVCGGVSVNKNGPFVQKTAEIWNPQTGNWSKASHMANTRFGHEALLLTDGLVIVAGGATPGGDCTAQRTAEIYYPDEDRWRLTSPMQTLRGFYFAAAIPGVGMLAAGGLTVPPDCQHVTPSTEIYDVNTATWIQTGDLSLPRGAIVPGGRLANGQFLVAGARVQSGEFAVKTATADLYDPVTGTWSLTGSMNMPRTSHTLTALPDGSALVVGGTDRATTTATAEIFTR